MKRDSVEGKNHIDLIEQYLALYGYGSGDQRATLGLPHEWPEEFTISLIAVPYSIWEGTNKTNRFVLMHSTVTGPMNNDVFNNNLRAYWPYIKYTKDDINRGMTHIDTLAFYLRMNFTACLAARSIRPTLKNNQPVPVYVSGKYLPRIVGAPPTLDLQFAYAFLSKGRDFYMTKREMEKEYEWLNEEHSNHGTEIQKILRRVFSLTAVDPFIH